MIPMTSPENTTHSLPGLAVNGLQLQARVVEQVTLARETYRIRFHCPELAKRITPGQFFMIRRPNCDDPLLARPFALYDTYQDSSGALAGIDVGYHVIGKMTSLLSKCDVGDVFEIFGPLGNGFAVPTGKHLGVVAGGIGYTPFVAAAKEALRLKSYGNRDNTNSPVERVSFMYGSRSEQDCADLSDIDLAGIDTMIATDDGSKGHHGRVTELLQQLISNGDMPDEILCCGPEPMMAATAEVCAAANIPCWVSLETPMACGFGACFSCVVRVRQTDEEWDYKRTCVEGPVFPAEQIQF